MDNVTDAGVSNSLERGIDSTQSDMGGYFRSLQIPPRVRLQRPSQEVDG